MQVVLTLPVLNDHGSHNLGHSHENVGPEDGADKVEPRVKWAHQLVVRVMRESLVRCQIREGLNEAHEGVLHEAVGAEPEDAHTGNGEGTPVTVQILFNCLMEHTIATKISSCYNHETKGERDNNKS